MLLKLLANKAKDAALQFVAAWLVNRCQFNKLGKMTTLKIDSEKQEIFVELDLRGEESPVELKVDYKVVGPSLIEIGNARSSREWIATLVNEMLPPEQKRIEVPEMVTTALSKLIR